MKKILSIFLAICILATFTFFAVGSGDDEGAKVESGESTTAAEATTKPGNVTVNVGDVLKTGNLEITYNECGEFTDYNQYLGPKDGYKFVYIDITAKNVGDGDAYISSFEFKGYADGAAVDQHYEGDEISATLSSGRTATGRVYFEVPKDAGAIEIEYETDYWENNKAIFIVK